LQYYEGPQGGTAILLSSAVDNGGMLGSVHSIDGVYYQIVLGMELVDESTPNGSAANPYRVAFSLAEDADGANVFERLVDALNATGRRGTDYSTTIAAPHPTVSAELTGFSSMEVKARVGGTASNSIPVARTTDGINPPQPEWSSATLLGGTDHLLRPSSVPDGVPISDLATLASHVVCVQARSRKFFWLRPGEVDIDPLDFSSAESEPDEIVNAIAVGDQLWLFGQSSTEAWYASGDSLQPFYRQQGRAFSQGVIPGTVARVQDAIVVVGQDRVVYRIAGTPERVSHHGIEEMLRRSQDAGL
jgi:hypothetical protein